jgi:alpha-tubulin suppressor-like RCC1 family protein
VLEDSGALCCWGAGDLGQLGTGILGDADEPARVSLDNDWATVGSGSEGSCGLKVDGSLYCWGGSSNWCELSTSGRIQPSWALG